MAASCGDRASTSEALSEPFRATVQLGWGTASSSNSRPWLMAPPILVANWTESETRLAWTWMSFQSIR